MKAAKRAAFFDVDETVITAKSMFDFLRYWLELRGDTDGSQYRALAGRLHDLAHNGGAPRTEVNRSYYRFYAGVPMAELKQAGEAWYADYRSRPAAFVEPTLAAMVQHQAAGDTIVLVSGSFRACLEPIARDLGADLILCSEPIVDADGVLTGEIQRPMIGPAKAEAVSETIAALGLDPADCAAYGDHSSDLDMLSRVGHPTVIGDDPVLTTHAKEHGWPVLPATLITRASEPIGSDRATDSLSLESPA